MVMTKHVPHHFVKDHREHDRFMEEIGDYMSTPVLSIHKDASVKEAANYMHSKNVSSLFVKDNGEYVGVFTETDLTHKVVAKGLNPESLKVADVMTTPVHTMDRSTPVPEANIYMARNRIRHLGVTENGKIVGVLSVKDLVSYFSNPRLRTW